MFNKRTFKILILHYEFKTKEAKININLFQVQVLVADIIELKPARSVLKDMDPLGATVNVIGTRRPQRASKVRQKNCIAYF